MYDLDLPVLWNESVADLHYSYTLEGIDETFGPRRVETYPAENTLGVVQASFQSQSVTVLDGRGQEIVGFEVLSPSGPLRNNGDVRPFDRLEIESPQHLSFVSDEPIALGIFFSLPFEWRGEGDLEFIWHAADSRALVTSVNYVNFGLPEPSTGSLAVFLLTVPLLSRHRLTASRRRKRGA